MTLRYEANPPKIDRAGGSPADLDRFVERLRRTSEVCGGIHITENVLGFRRVSPILVGRLLRGAVPDITLTLTVRVRDKSAPEIDAFARDALDAGFSGMLVVAGDRDPKSQDSGQVPSKVVRRLRQDGLAEGLDLYLSVPANPDYSDLGPKVRARPRGFITQVVQHSSQVRVMAERLQGFDILPIVLYPSPKNQKAASFLGIDMSLYSNRFQSFVDSIYDAAGDILLTSPGDHAGLYEFLLTHRY